MLVNTLAGLLIITSLLVICVKRPTASAVLYALQSLILVFVFIAMANTMHAKELYGWSISAFITKVILVPVIMYRALGSLSDPVADKGGLGTGWTVVAGALIMLLCYGVVETVQLPAVAALKPALGVSLGHFLVGVLCIVSQRNILKQIFGYCLMENGAHLTLALLAYKAPELVEIGVATDSIFAVVIMTVIARQIFHTLNTLDVRQLTALKG